MKYTEKEARELVIKAGLELIDKKLIARTWGNISAKISDSQFVITPSGKPYDKLKPEDLVVVNMSDLSYEGDVKPSSEKGIHANVYLLRDNINFVIHTHQNYATAISVEGKDTDFAPCAKYGLPGTKGLMKEVVKSIKANPSSDSFLLERHGAIFFGETYDDAFNKANDVEKKAEALFKKEAHDSNKTRKPYLDDYAQIYGLSEKDPTTEDAEALALIKGKNELAAKYASSAKPMNIFDVLLQHTVYKMKYSKLKDKK